MSVSIAYAVACDFIGPGAEDPLTFHPAGREALLLALQLANLFGELPSALDQLLDLTYALEGRGDSPSAARAIREAMSTSAEVRASLGLAGDRTDVRRLSDLAKRRVRAEERVRSAAPR